MSEFEDEQFMRRAIWLAEEAQAAGEVPVGALVVKNSEVIGTGWTQQITNTDPSAHAEVIALRNAAKKERNHRVVGSTLYVTLEPCMMCAGLMVHARISRLVYGALAPKTGVVESNGSLLEWSSHNHHVETTSGVLREECAELLTGFFKARRKEPETSLFLH